MKRYITFMIALVSFTTLWAQDWKIIIYADDQPAMEYKTSTIDSIVFEENIPITIDVEDGWYVYGLGTSAPVITSQGKMTPAKEDLSGTSREGMMEMYIAIKEGGAFNIGKVKNKVLSNYGPDYTFYPEEVFARINSEPKEALYRGQLGENNIKFIIPESGLYHIVYDLQLNTYSVAKAEWGIIGEATPQSWTTSMEMSSTFALESMTFTIDNLELQKGDFKFRYSNGWRVYLAYNDDVDKRVATYTYLGGELMHLHSGGLNLHNANPGLYTVALTWQFGHEFTATMTKTGEIPMTDWSEIKFDIAGSGISVENTDAETDLISHWGQRLMADNEGLPILNEDIYTYTWETVELVDGEAFKLRHLLNEMTVQNEIGYAQLDTNKSSNLVVEDQSSNNLKISKGGEYTISIQIFANNNDSISLIITEVTVVKPRVEKWYIWVQGSTHNVMNYEIQLQPIYNLATLTPFPNLIETYMAIDSGGTFYLMRNQDILTRHGPGSDFAMVNLEDRRSNEPTGTLYKGTVQEDADVFTVHKKGLYHIVLNTSTRQCALAKADWGLIGSATPNGWDSNIPMKMDFTVDSIRYTIDSVNLTSDADIKFRYNDGWNVYLQTPDGQSDSIGAYTNLGSKYLVSGGSNIPILQTSTYSVTLQWKIGENFTYKFTPLELPTLSDWSMITWDATGTAISNRNTNATMDTLWNWGYSLWADNNGLPTYNNGIYTYQWSDVQMLGEEGFKLREINNNSIKQNRGYTTVNKVLSSNKIHNNLGNNNIELIANGLFDISLNIDANNNDTMYIVLSEKDNDTIVTPNYTDGWYIYGNATALDSISPLGKMTPAIDEQHQESSNTNIFETYLAISSTGTFNLVQITDVTSINFSPSPSFTRIEKGANPTDEPQALFYKGSIIENTAPFSVDEDGLYHIIYNKTDGTLIIAKAEWGIIGGATNFGWSNDTKLSSTFESHSIKFAGNDISLQGGESIKFRYSDAWRITLSPNTSDTLNNGVSVFTNFGGTFDQLILGGDNIPIDTSGIYDLDIVWELGNGFSASKTWKSDLLYTNWSTITWDIVGTGVSDTNTKAEIDTLWSWGQRLWADNNGLPLEDNDIYTYTWTEVSINADEGFKIRRLNADGTYMSDIGFSGLSNSASNLYTQGNDNNISTSTSGLYNITLIIDATKDNKMTATIVESIE